MCTATCTHKPTCFHASKHAHTCMPAKGHMHTCANPASHGVRNHLVHVYVFAFQVHFGRCVSFTMPGMSRNGILLC